MSRNVGVQGPSATRARDAWIEDLVGHLQVRADDICSQVVCGLVRKVERWNKAEEGKPMSLPIHVD